MTDAVTPYVPSTAFQASVHYDPNHNALNAPCEGPKVVPIPRIQLHSIPAGVDRLVYTIDFTQLIKREYVTKIQSFYYNASIANAQAILTTDLNYSWRLVASGKTSAQIPIFCGNNPFITIVIPGGFPTVNDYIDLVFCNYVPTDSYINTAGV